MDEQIYYHAFFTRLMSSAGYIVESNYENMKMVLEDLM